MPPTRPTPNPNAGKGLERAMQLGMDLVRQARDAAKANAAPASRDRQMAEAHRAALVRYEGQVRQHQGRIAGAKVGMVAGGAGTAVLGLSAVASAPSPGAMVFLGGLTAGTAALGWRARRRAKDLEAHPPVPQLPPLPPARLRPGARGADQADQVANALLHLYDLVPNVGRLYPQAGQELWRAVSDVEPLLRGQVERLASLDRIEWEMPGSRAAQAAVAAGTEITGRVRAGADALEDLIAAAARMLAAPDIGEGVPDALAPAIDSLDAFAHGLHAANAARLGNGWRPRMEPTLVVTPRGVDFQMEVVARHQSWYDDAGYEPLSTALWQRLSRISDQIVDIGAHVGWYSIHAARSNPSARVVAVEGGPQTAEVCRRNCESIVPGSVVVHSAVFASTPGFIDFHVAEASDNSSRSGHPSSPTVETLLRPAITGPDLGLEPGRSLLIKVDVEGHELDTLQALAEQIDASSSTRIILELNPKCLAQAGSAPEAVLGWLRSRGFKIYRLDDRVQRWAFVPENQPADALVPKGAYTNLYCVRGADVVGSDFVLHSSSLGGAERSTLSLVERLTAAGHLVHCYLPDRDAGLGARLEGVGVTISRYPGRWWAHADPDVDWTQAAEGLDRILADLRNLPAEVVVSITGVVPIGALAARLAGLPHIWSLHEYMDDDHGLALPASLQDLGAFIMEHSVAVVANSDSVAQHVLGRSADRVIPPLDWADIERIPLGDSREDVPRVLGFFSSLNPGKGLAELVEALARLLRDGRDLVLSVYGEGPAEESQAMIAMAGRLGIADRITFHGRSDEPLKDMAGVDLVVMPSRREAFGRVPIEAVFVGRPVVYARGSGMDDYMLDGVTGVAFDPRDPVSLASAIARVLDDSELRRALAESAAPALEAWLGRIDTTCAWASLLIDAASTPRHSEWSDKARSVLIMEASGASVKQQCRLAEDLDRTRRELDLVVQDRQAVDADRQRLHQVAESWQSQAEDLRGGLNTALSQVSAAQAELGAAQGESEVTQAELDRIRSTLRYRSTFGWRSRLRLGRVPEAGDNET